MQPSVALPNNCHSVLVPHAALNFLIGDIGFLNLIKSVLFTFNKNIDPHNSYSSNNLMLLN